MTNDAIEETAVAAPENEKLKRTGNAFQQAKTHCPNGHEYTKENTIRIKSTKPGRFKRQCRLCKQNWAKQSNRDKKAAQKAADERQLQEALAGTPGSASEHEASDALAPA